MPRCTAANVHQDRKALHIDPQTGALDYRQCLATIWGSPAANQGLFDELADL